MVKRIEATWMLPRCYSLTLPEPDSPGHSSVDAPTILPILCSLRSSPSAELSRVQSITYDSTPRCVVQVVVIRACVMIFRIQTLTVSLASSLSWQLANSTEQRTSGIGLVQAVVDRVSTSLYPAIVCRCRYNI